jgi:hypothetical protein
MKYNKNRTNVQGSLLLIRHLPDGTIYRVKSNAVEGLSVGQDTTVPYGWASFSGKATYQEPSWPDAVGNHRFVTYVEDRNEPGIGADRFWLEIRNPSNGVVGELSLPASASSNASSLGGGNIVVPHAQGK